MECCTYIRRLHENPDAESIRIGLIAFASFMTLTFILSAEGYRFVYGDVGHYWDMSSRLEAVFDPLFLPGYPAVLFVVRHLTGSLLPAPVVLLGISCISFVIGNVLFLRIFSIFNPSDAFKGSLLFLYFPFVGVTAVVEPRADGMAFMLLLTSLLAILKGRITWFCLLGSLALLTHKALWPFIAGLALAALVRGTLKWYHLAILALPLGLLFLAGAWYHQNMMWMFSQHFEVVAVPRGGWPLLDGIIGSFRLGEVQDVTKAIMAVVMLFLSLFLSYQAVREDHLFMLGLLIPIAFWCIVLNHYEIWAAIRFGKIIVLPLLVVPSFLLQWWQLAKSSRLFLFLLLLLLITSQFVFIWSIKVRFAL